MFFLFCFFFTQVTLLKMSFVSVFYLVNAGNE